MKYKTEQEKFWANQFGIDYIKRNNSEFILNSKINMWKNGEPLNPIMEDDSDDSSIDSCDLFK